MKARSHTVYSGIAAILLSSSVSAEISTNVTEVLLGEYQAEGAGSFSASAGEALWLREENGRSCTNCHSDSLSTQGRHQRTGKVIEPMSPQTNPVRFTDPKKVNKWFLRNCKWTFGRQCTAQEKGDTLLWLSQQ